jgi:hypothetical protein
MSATTGSKLEAMFKEFPFLRRFVKKDKKWEIKVERVDGNIMEERKKGNWEDDDSYPQRIFLIDSFYEILAEVGIKETTVFRLFNWSGRIPMETTEEALRRIGADAIAPSDFRNEVRFVVRVEYFPSNQGEGTIIVFKPPKGYTIAGWIAEERRRAEAELVKELAAIDNV